MNAVGRRRRIGMPRTFCSPIECGIRGCGR
jgi:hypothetical protein